MATKADLIDKANANDLPSNLSGLRDDDEQGFGYLLRNLIPQEFTRTGFTSSATQIDRATDTGEGEPGTIQTVESPAGTALRVVGAGVTPGATEVAVAYDSNGVPTLTFAAAVTDWVVTKTRLPVGMADYLDTEV